MLVVIIFIFNKIPGTGGLQIVNGFMTLPVVCRCWGGLSLCLVWTEGGTEGRIIIKTLDITAQLIRLAGFRTSEA